MKINEIITEARTPIEKEYDLPKLKNDPVDDAERYGLEHDQPYELNTGSIEARDFLRLVSPILSPKEKAVITCELHGMHPIEIAKKYNVSLAKIRMIQAKAIRKMRRWSQDKETGFERDPTAWFESLLKEAKLGTNPKRSKRAGSRPERGHKPVERYRKNDDEFQLPADLEAEKWYDRDAEVYGTKEDFEVAEHGKASRQLCTSSRPDSDLGASNLASCKSQGLRARDGKKSHKLGKSKKSRITVGGHKIKGAKYGGPLPDWS